MSREQILGRVRRALSQLDAVPHPGRFRAQPTPCDLRQLFAERLSELAGSQTLHQPADAEACRELLRRLLSGVEADQVLGPEPPSAPARREHRLGIAHAVAACAASASVLVDAGSAEGGLCSLLVEHSVIFVPAGALVADLLEWTQSAGALARSRYLVAIAGASRTADIEKTLVSPAHGPARLSIVLLPEGVDPPGRAEVEAARGQSPPCRNEG